MKNLNIVTMGGGGGHAQVLKSLKGMPGFEITGICPSTDSGGSTGTLKRDYQAKGHLGDLTKCMVALCPDTIISKALSYRYGTGALEGHSVKNMLLLGLESVTGQKEALAKFGELCSLGRHRILPVTDQRTELCATLRLGNKVISETNIDELAKNPLWHPDTHAIVDIYLEPKVSASMPVMNAIKRADWIIICPGDFYSSIVPTLLPKGIKESLAKSKAKIILILNIVNKKGETHHYTADDFVSRVEKYIGKKVDIVLCNDRKIPQRSLLDYALENKIAFKPTSKNKKDSRIRYAPFAEVAKDGTLVHDLEALKKEFGRMLG